MIYPYEFKYSNNHSENYKYLADFKCSGKETKNFLHLIKPQYNTIIGQYTNKKEINFDTFTIFKQQCPNCNNEIIESSCHNCCHDETCGLVNYVGVNIFYICFFFYYKRPQGCDDMVPVANLKNTCMGDVVIDGRIHHHTCPKCHYEFFTLEN